ncbi:MAG: hypothetical protein WCO51_05985 [bacterium]
MKLLMTITIFVGTVAVIGLIAGITRLTPNVAKEDDATVQQAGYQLESTRKVSVSMNRLDIPQPNGLAKEVPVTIEVSAYRLKLRSPYDAMPRYPVHCATVRSMDDSFAFSHSVCSSTPFAEMQLLKGDYDKPYLAWVEFSLLYLVDISSANDRGGLLKEWLAAKGEIHPAYVRVHLGALVPAIDSWGQHGEHLIVKVHSIARDTAGNLTVQVSGTKQDKLYTLSQDKTAQFGWRVK